MEKYYLHGASQVLREARRIGNETRLIRLSSDYWMQIENAQGGRKRTSSWLQWCQIKHRDAGQPVTCRCRPVNSRLWSALPAPQAGRLATKQFSRCAKRANFHPKPFPPPTPMHTTHFLLPDTLRGLLSPLLCFRRTSTVSASSHTLPRLDTACIMDASPSCSRSSGSKDSSMVHNRHQVHSQILFVFGPLSFFDDLQSPSLDLRRTRKSPARGGGPHILRLVLPSPCRRFGKPATAESNRGKDK